MALAVTHNYTSAIADDAADSAAGKITPTRWNAAHTIAGLGTGVETALGVNVGTAGAVVVNGGALGTPASGTLTNCTGLPPSGLTAAIDLTASGAGGVTGILPSANGGTANGFTKFTGPATSEKTFTLPNASDTIATYAVANTFTLAQTVKRDSIGASTADGLLLTNTTAAAAGAQQWSPRAHWTGQGWKTTATAASQTVDWIAELVPVQGAANPVNTLVFSSQINGGGYTTGLTLSHTSGNSPTLNPAGNIQMANAAQILGNAQLDIGFSTTLDRWSSTACKRFISGTVTTYTAASLFALNSATALAFSSTTDASGTLDTGFKRSAAGIVGVTNGSTGGGAIELQEMTAPAAGSTNFVRIYAVDNGAGKTQLMAIFPTGAAQQIAIEP